MENNQNQQVDLQQTKSIALGITSLTFSVIAIIMACCIGYIGIIFATLGFITGIVGIAKKQGALAITGTILSVISLLASAAWIYVITIMYWI